MEGRGGRESEGETERKKNKKQERGVGTVPFYGRPFLRACVNSAVWKSRPRTACAFERRMSGPDLSFRSPRCLLDRGFLATRTRKTKRTHTQAPRVFVPRRGRSSRRGRSRPFNHLLRRSDGGGAANQREGGRERERDGSLI